MTIDNSKDTQNKDYEINFPNLIKLIYKYKISAIIGVFTGLILSVVGLVSLKVKPITSNYELKLLEGPSLVSEKIDYVKFLNSYIPKYIENYGSHFKETLSSSIQFNSIGYSRSANTEEISIVVKHDLDIDPESIKNWTQNFINQVIRLHNILVEASLNPENKTEPNLEADHRKFKYHSALLSKKEELFELGIELFRLGKKLPPEIYEQIINEIKINRIFTESSQIRVAKLNTDTEAMFFMLKNLLKFGIIDEPLQSRYFTRIRNLTYSITSLDGKVGSLETLLRESPVIIEPIPQMIVGRAINSSGPVQPPMTKKLLGVLFLSAACGTLFVLLRAAYKGF